MGKNIGSKTISSKTNLKATPKNFFKPKKAKPSSEIAGDLSLKMAAQKYQSQPRASGTSAESADLPALLEKMEQRLSAKLFDIQSALARTASMAETALNISSSLKEEVKEIKARETNHNERLLTIETQMRLPNLKFRGVPEGEEGNIDLIIFMGTWLAKAFHLGAEDRPAILKAYRLGAPSNPKRKGPRDILVQFADGRTRQSILEVSLTIKKLLF